MTQQSSRPQPRRVKQLLVAAQQLAGGGRQPEAIHLLEGAGLDDEQGLLRLTAAQLRMQAGDLHGAILRLTDLLDDASRRGDLPLLAEVCHQFAVIYRTTGDFRLARRFQQRVLQLIDGCDHIDLTHVANDALAQGRFEVAETLARTALEMQEPHALAESADLAADYGTLGLAAAGCGELDEATRHLVRAFQLHRSHGDQTGMAIDLVNLGEVLQCAGRPRGWIRCLRRALRMAESAGAGDLVSRVRQQLTVAEEIARELDHDPRLN